MTVKPIPTAEQALAEALAAHRDFTDDEALQNVTIGRYSDHLGTAQVMGPDDRALAGSFYWEVIARTTRKVMGPAPRQETVNERRPAAWLANKRQIEITEIIEAYTACLTRIEERESTP
jgi:hypothetical protein